MNSNAVFVMQPNGLLARFSYAISDLTHVNLTKKRAIEVASITLAKKQAKALVDMAFGATQMLSWEDVLEIIEVEQGPVSRKEIEFQVSLQIA